MPYIKSIRLIGTDQHVARVSVERSEIIVHDDKLPHFEGKQYRALGWMNLIDGEDWKPNGRGVDERIVEVGVVPIEPDGTSFIQMRLSKSLLEPKKKKRTR